MILDWYAGEVRKLWSNLAVSTAYTPVSEELLALASQAKDPSVHRLDEPYRLALELIVNVALHGCQLALGDADLVGTCRRRDDAAGVLRCSGEEHHVLGQPAHRAHDDAVEREIDQRRGDDGNPQ